MNPLKQAMRAGQTQFGLWQALANPYTAEICAGTGYDWLLIDGEHAPNTMQTLLGQLQAVSRHPVEPVGRPPVGDAAIIKQYLDIGFRSLMIPMVDSGAQAAAMVAATRFPPEGCRGVASATSRASGFGADAAYLRTTHEEHCIILQIESRAALDAIDEIGAVQGVDGLFIGPGDLAAALGHIGNPGHRDVQQAIDHALERIKASGKAAGIFAFNEEDARTRIAQGFSFVSLGTDIGLLIKGARDLVERVKAG
jgi:4-hydroxy-2-oxoheptanedioate aldolase